jgi:DNA adenine methylase
MKMKKIECEAKDANEVSAALNVNKQYYIPITKSDEEEQTVTGIVLQPESVDAQGDIIGTDVISKAAHNFLASYNRRTKLGLMHNDFKPQFELYESSIVTEDTVINKNVVKSGSWLVMIHVLDKNIWEQVKTRKLNGFSIGGKALARQIQE